MRRITEIVLWACLALLLMAGTACSRSFKVQGRIMGLGSQNVQMLWANAEGTGEQWVAAKQGRFELKGQSKDYALVVLCDAQGTPIARFVLKNGDKIKIRGELDERYQLEVKGPKANEEWFQFMNEHAAVYQGGDRSVLDPAIEQFVKQHPGSMASTLLALLDYGQPDKVDALLKQIEPEAQPKSLIDAVKRLKQWSAQPPVRINSFILLDSKGDYASFSPVMKPATLLYVWTPEVAHQQRCEQIKQLATRYGTRLQVADVCLAADSLQWRGALQDQAFVWPHYWAPEGPMNSQVKPMNITATPTFVVADSLGRVKYFGARLDAAAQSLQQLLQ